MPPRTTSKPLISVTAQSSTESTQDAYQDGRAARLPPWAQDGRGLYGSTDSLDSSKAVSLALEAAAAQRHATEGQRTGDKPTPATKAEEFLRNRRSSIGVQVAQAVPSPRPSHPHAPGHSCCQEAPLVGRGGVGYLQLSGGEVQLRLGSLTPLRWGPQRLWGGQKRGRDA